MLLAQFEAYYSRPFAPTRRVALGEMRLPSDPAPGPGPVLLGGILAQWVPRLDDDLDDELDGLIDDLERGRRIAQPRFRHRLQEDRVGLQRCRHRLFGEGERTRFDLDDSIGTPAQHVACALYAAAALGPVERPAVFAALRKAMAWRGPVDDRLVAHLLDRRAGVASGGADPVAWALEVLDLRPAAGARVHRREVQRAYRELLIEAHPDHGGDQTIAAERIARLGEARRILLGA